MTLNIISEIFFNFTLFLLSLCVYLWQNAVWWSRRDGWGGESPDLGFQGYAGKNSLLLVIFLSESGNCREFMLDFCVIEENKL